MKSVISLFFIFLLAYPIYSQILDVERFRLQQDSLNIISGKVGDTFQSVKNNDKNLLNFGITSNILIDQKIYKFIYLGNLSSGSINNSSFSNDGYQHFRFTRKINNICTFESFTQIAYNKILKLKLRSLTGIGIRFNLMKSKIIIVHFGTSIMYEYEHDFNNEYFQNIRMSNYISCKLKIKKNLLFINTTYYQPAIFNIRENKIINLNSNYRISTYSSLQIALFDHLNFSFNVNYYFDSTPLIGISGTNYNLLNTFTYTFN